MEEEAEEEWDPGGADPKKRSPHNDSGLQCVSIFLGDAIMRIIYIYIYGGFLKLGYHPTSSF